MQRTKFEAIVSKIPSVFWIQNPIRILDYNLVLLITILKG